MLDEFVHPCRHMKEEERRIVELCLEKVEEQADKRREEYLNEWAFFAGVVNSMLITWSFGAVPEHFWILYVVETLILFPMRWKMQVNAKPLNQTTYWLDFCWFANFLGNLIIAALVGIPFFAGEDAIPDGCRKLMFGACWGVATGPLLLATAFIGNALVFHDPNNTVSMFIHVFPSLAMYTIRWHAPAVRKAWPHVFHLNYLDSIDVWGDICLPAVVFYVSWWVPYIFWLIIRGMDMPKSGKDTIFHANMRGGLGGLLAKHVTKRSAQEQKRRSKENDFTTTDALCYMMFHGILVCIAVLVSIPCFTWQYFHAFLNTLMTLSAVYNGASRYSYFMLKSYGKAIRGLLAEARTEERRRSSMDLTS